MRSCSELTKKKTHVLVGDFPVEWVKCFFCRNYWVNVTNVKTIIRTFPFLAKSNILWSKPAVDLRTTCLLCSIVNAFKLSWLSLSTSGMCGSSSMQKKKKYKKMKENNAIGVVLWEKAFREWSWSRKIFTRKRARRRKQALRKNVYDQSELYLDR